MKREMTHSDESRGKADIFVLKPYNHKQLAGFYEVSWLTFQRWVKRNESEIGKKIGHFYSIPQVLVIFRIFGMPKRFKLTLQEVEEMFNH